ncbi:MAG: hypothetical protein JW888_16095 [Pirellulales bacterium]|nr:hypothetical protein [Pirellulales bacterium]
MPSTERPRRQYFVDANVQGDLVWRLILYWCTCLATVMLTLLGWRILAGPMGMPIYYHFGDVLFYYGPALVVSMVILPLVIIDIIQFSNRFAGPMVRLRRAMRALARGEHVEAIHFRQHDYWRALAAEFNEVVARVQQETAERSQRVESEKNRSDAGPASSGEQSANTALVENGEDSQLETVGADSDS